MLGPKKHTLRLLFVAILFSGSLAFVLLTSSFARASALSNLVAQMQPGTWATLTPASTSALSGLMNINAYADSGVWDPVRQQYRFCGGYHGDTMHCVVYDEATNTWNSYPNATGSTVVHHAYDTNTIDPVHGYTFIRITNISGALGGTVWRYNIAAGTWTQLATPPVSVQRPGGMLVYFPGYNGIGGLIFMQNTFDYMYFLPDGASSWQRIPNSNNLYTVTEATWHFGEYNPVLGFMVFGAGTGKLWKLTASGAISPYNDIPTSVNIYDGGNGQFTVDPVTGKYLVLSATTRTFWEFDPIGDTWTQGTNQPPGLTSAGLSQTPVSSYGVTLWMNCGATTSICDGRLLVYKGAAGSGTPPPPSLAPTVVLSANPTSVPSGSASTLSWSSTNATSCTASGGWSGTTALSGSQSTGNLSQNTNFTLTCTGGGGSASQTTAVTVTSSTTTPPPTSADADFQARCSAPGVIKCVGFDNTTTDIVPNVNLGPASNNQFYGGLDTSVKASGAGSLRFRLAAGNAFANIAGQWLPPLTDKAMGNRTFGQNSEFYAQYRIRFSPEMFSNLAYWNSWWKQSIFHMNFASCAGIEITTNYRNYSSPTDLVPNFYTECGAHGFGTDPVTNAYKYNGAPPITQQQGDYFGLCNYNVWTNCWHYSANEWITFYYHVKIGTWNARNSVVEVWVSRPSTDNGIYKKIINVQDMILTCNNDCSASSTEGYNNISLTPYMTQLSTAAPVDAYVWYDELIVSTQPIQAPGVTAAAPSPTPPAAPTALTLQ